MAGGRGAGVGRGALRVRRLLRLPRVLSGRAATPPRQRCAPGASARICLRAGVSTSFTSRSLGRWFPLLIVALYNVGDLAGKALPGAVRLIRTRAALLCCVGCHVCFVPLFLGALHAQRAAPASAPLSDAVPMALALSLGVSSGYLGCTALMLASEREGDAELKVRAGTPARGGA